ncbi:MAG: hypothetical protein AAF790_09180 [Planctomycetota bacterium]
MRRTFLLCQSAAAALLLTGLIATDGSAELVAYDPFLSGGNRGVGEYTPGVDVRAQGTAALGWVGTSGLDGFGIQHAGNTSNFVGNALGEDYFGVDYEQGGRLQWLGVGDFPFNRNITRQLNPTPASSEWWVSIMLNRLAWEDAPASNTYVVGGFTDAGGNGLQIGYDDGVSGDGLPDLVLRSNSINTVLAADAPANDNQLVLVRLLVNAAGDDVIEVWADPPSVSLLPAPTLVITDQNVTDSLTPFSQSRYESPGQSGVVYFDEVRLGTTFSAVTGIPEPSGLLLSLAAGLPLAAWRRGGRRASGLG